MTKRGQRGKSNFKQAWDELTMANTGSTPDVDSDTDDTIIDIPVEEVTPVKEADVQSTPTLVVDDTPVITPSASVVTSAVSTTTLSVGSELTGNLAVDGNLQLAGVVKGHLTVSGHVAIQGSVAGNITADGMVLANGSVQAEKVTIARHLVIDNDATLVGNVQCGSLQLNARLNGDVSISGHCEILQNACVVGNISCGTITIATGAQIKGSIETVGL